MRRSWISFKMRILYTRFSQIFRRRMRLASGALARPVIENRMENLAMILAKREHSQL